ncbi:hypothetical protein B0H15DRAFT_927222 [Mycena belliarum]|uniref:Uncharacterized protein n=1 Tax=Mycena belliarum TaxID=1033014 RepID=A0AAD6UM99_9AGAR|nr:hypothetical protein B0H15DRAFT_927222 [Mycena belliae]
MPPSFEHTVNTDQATFLGFGLEGIGYGVNLVLFMVAITVLVRRNPTASKMPIFAVTCLMFSLCTVHFSLNFHNVYTGLMVHPRPHISEETPLLAGADMIFAITDFFSQLILIYRCYIVWGKTVWIIILPVLVAFASVACGVGLIGLVLSIDPTAPQTPAAIVPVGDAAFAMSLILNFSTSMLIVGRIWYMSRQSRIQGVAHHKTSVQSAMEIVIESGLLFLAAQFVFVVLFAIAHPAQAVVEPIATQIYGISPTLIIVRVGMGRSYEQTTKTPMTSVRFVNFNKKAESRNDTDLDDTRNASAPDLELSPYKGGSSKGTLAEHAQENDAV